MSKKKYAAIHTTFYTVYKYGYMFGGLCRIPAISFPERNEAEAWIAKHKNDSVLSYYKLDVEEMPCTIKAWDGKIPE